MIARHTILLVGYPFAPVRPDAVGGAEQVLASLDRALTERGHRCIVVAPAGSRTHGELVSIRVPTGPIDDHVRRLAHAAVRRAVETVLSRTPVDVVHLHGVDFPNYLPRKPVPTLVSLHLPPDAYAPSAFQRLPAHVSLCFVSETQARAWPAKTRVAGCVPNGVRLADFAPFPRKLGYAVSLGRICPEKGYHLALEATRRAGCPYMLAGKVYPYEAHVQYFEQAIRPRLGAMARFIGAVDPGARRALLAQARCLLVPSLSEETSGLVAMEALASGTPVIAFDRGALRETIRHGRTGYLVDDVADMAEAIARVDRLDPSACREDAIQRFPEHRMHEGYLALYDQLMRCAFAERREVG